MTYPIAGPPLDSRTRITSVPVMVSNDVGLSAAVACNGSVVAGIGNMWLAEALWQARVSPWAALGAVSDEELSNAIGWAREAMRAAVRGPRGPRAVYRRAGMACRRCGTPIASRGLGDANRTAYWCPRCQLSAGAPG